MSDPEFSNVTTLIDFEASPGLVDQSNSGASWTIISDAQLSTAQAKFGSQSLDIVSDGYAEYSGAAVLFNVAGDFTIQMWVRPDAIGAAQTLVESGGFYWGITASGAIEVIGKDSGGTTVVSFTTTQTLTAGAWNYVEVSRATEGQIDFSTGATTPLWRQFVAGVEQTGSETGTVDSAAYTKIGRKSGLSGLNPFVGYIDELRITDGEVVNSSTYTPPTSAHPTSSGGTNVYVSAVTPLGAPQSVALQGLDISVRSLTVSPLGAPESVVTVEEITTAFVSVPSMLAAPRLNILNDFSRIVDRSVSRYILRITGSPPVDIKISSWQSTLQTGRRNYLQAVIPAVTQWLGLLSARQGTEEFAIYRTSFVGSQPVESEMARAPLSAVVLASGPFRDTATVSGYGNQPDEETAPNTVPLDNVRQLSQTLGGSVRVRADIDWFLRPGQEVSGAGVDFTASYINYFVPTRGDAYMDVGNRG